MRSISNAEIDLIQTLFQRYGSLRKVAVLCNRSPATIKKYVSDKALIVRKNIVSTVSHNEILKGLYIGLWMGDGTQYYNQAYEIKICSNKRQRELNSFIQRIILDLFGKKTNLIEDKNTNRAYIKFRSKFIFEWIENYVSYSSNKTKTIRLLGSHQNYDPLFRDGLLLGLCLSDGYLKGRFKFNVISKNLSCLVIDLLKLYGYQPSQYVHDRSRWGWHDLYMVSLNKLESQELNFLLDSILIQLDCKMPFKVLKNGPDVI